MTTCQLCSYTFSSLFTFRSHMEFHNGTRPYLCRMCGNAFKTKADMLRHLRRVSGYEAGELLTKGCLKVHDLDEETQDLIIKDHSHVPCPHEGCTWTFSTPARLERHKGFHDGSRPYLCNGCGQGFTSGSHLDKHQKSCQLVIKSLHVKNTDNIYECPRCPQSISVPKGGSMRAGFVTHFQKHCSGSNLRCRVLVHSNEQDYKGPSRTYACDHACKNFVEYRRHLQRKHPDEDFDAHCATAWEPIEDVLAEMLAKPFSCAEKDCKKRFATKRELTVHTFHVHSDERPFRCSLCTGAFKTSSKLLRHCRQVHDKNTSCESLECETLA